MALSPIERLRTIKELRGALAQSKDAKTPIARLKAIKAVRAARQKLGIGLGAAAPAPATEQPDSYIEALQKIASGAFDHQGLHEVMRLIQTAINGLGGAALMVQSAQDQANKAIDHWVELEAA